MLIKMDVHEHVVKLTSANIFVIYLYHEVQEDHEVLKLNDLTQILSILMSCVCYLIT
jgi:hypothetical protein